MKLAIIIITSLLFVGCSSIEKNLRSKHAFHVLVKDKEGISVDPEVKKLIAIRCISTSETVGFGDLESKENICTYLSVDAKNLIGHPDLMQTTIAKKKEMRNKITKLLVHVSDYNCSAFLGRVFANKAFRDIGTSTSKDILTGISAGTVTASPDLSAGLGVINLVTGSAVNNINKELFVNKSFSAMQKVIEAKRINMKKTQLEAIYSKSYDNASIYESLSLVRKYNDSCSIKDGLSELESIASKQLEKAKDSPESENENPAAAAN